ncbi:MAG TPA: ABC transporter substrate-binding protein [Anaerolineae bacterium]|nr:ABC transporter substrate-binding protein [Anaerolineae bacterium]
MSKNVPFFVIAGIFVVGLTLSACGVQSEADVTPSEPPSTVLPTTEEGMIQVTDAMGRVIMLPHLPQRIVVPGKGTWMPGHVLYMFPEASERVLAMEERKGSASDFLPLIDPSFNDKPHVEYGASAEQIVPLNPDAIVMKSYMAETLGEPLELLGFPVIYVELETPDQFFRDLATLGQLLGNEARAQEIEAYYQTRIDRVEQGVSGAERPRVLVIQHNSSGEEVAFEIPPAAWMQTIQVEMAGGTPVWREASQGGGWTVVNLEQIAAWDPDIIFVIAFRADPGELVEELKADPKWQALQAVQNEKLYGFPLDIYGWDLPDPRWILGLTWVATKIHPNRFADIDMMQEVYDFYGQMYGMDRAAVEEHILPVLKGDL